MHRFNLPLTVAFIALPALPGITAAGAEEREAQHMAPLAGRFLAVTQAWGALGKDTAAHWYDKPGEPLRIGDKTYEHGLGAHANGTIHFDLRGEYDLFEAVVGVQHQEGGAGSVVFRVVVDDQERFSSGVMRQDTPAKPVRIPIEGAMELRLITEDAGDGIASDMGNWAEAVLRPARDGPARRPPSLNVAPFARVITCDPARMTGSRANRIEEFHADDVYPERDAVPGKRIGYTVEPNPDGKACIGLRWLERRRLNELSLAFPADPTDPIPSVEGAEVQMWVGESPWQGGWKRMEGKLTAQGLQWIFRPGIAPQLDIDIGTRKIRWIIPTTRPVIVLPLSAMSIAPTRDVKFTLEMDPPQAKGNGVVEIYNGVGDKLHPQQKWNLSEPLELALRVVRPRPWLAERTVLRFTLPTGSFAVAAQDVLDEGAVLVRSHGLFVADASRGITRDAYRKSIADRRTVLEEVRARPDQTFAQALEHVHNPRQNLPPMMLSLACDDVKFVTQRDGTVEFSPEPEKAIRFIDKSQPIPARLVPKFGAGGGTTRKLEGDWLPIPVVESRDGNLVYRQRTFVAPAGEPAKGNPYLNSKPLCVSEFTAGNVGADAERGSLELTFMAGKELPATIDMVTPTRGLVRGRDRLLAIIELDAEKPRADISGNTLRLSGKQPAGNTSRCRVLIPGWVASPDDPALSGGTDYYAATVACWQRLMDGKVTVDVPDALLMNVIKASQVHCLIAARNVADGERVAPWIASWVYGPLESECNSILRAMGMFGHEDFCRRGFDYYVHQYRDNGMMTTGYTLMGMGWHLQRLGEHYRRTQDRAWLESVAPKVATMCRWIRDQRKKTMQGDAGDDRPPEYGLMPPGVMADWNAFAYYFCLNGYYCDGLREAGLALRDINHPDADAILADAKDFRDAILGAYRWTQKIMPVYPLRDGTSVEGYPSQVHCPSPTNTFFPGEDANRSWCYDVELGAHHLVPQGILDPMSPEVTAMLDHMEDVQYLASGWYDYDTKRNHADWYNLGGFSKVQPYYTRNGEIYALRDDIKPFVRTYFNTLPSLLNMEVLSLQEHFSGVGAWNKTHETGYFLQQTRFMLLLERGDELWLNSLTTDQWLKQGMTIAIHRAPTLFGEAGFEIRSKVDEGVIEATIDPPVRTKPKALVLRLRHPDGTPIKAVTVNGKRHEDFDNDRQIIRLPAGDQPLQIRAEY